MRFKACLNIVFILITSVAFSQSSLPYLVNQPKSISGCRCNGVPLYGKVKVVSHNADFTVQEVQAFQDLDVLKVPGFASKCGEWQFVDANPDFTIQFVDHYPDFKIKFVNAFPGIH